MPLVQDLKNPAMRERHWAQIKSEVQKSFDHSGKKFEKHSVLFNVVRWLTRRSVKKVLNQFSFDKCIYLPKRD